MEVILSDIETQTTQEPHRTEVRPSDIETRLTDRPIQNESETKRHRNSANIEIHAERK